MDGVVIDKQVDVGDTVTPGQVLVTIFDPTRMQLVASVRESLALQLQTGQDLEVVIQGLDKQCRGTISEIVPEAKTASRTFQVKVTGPCPDGIYSGMFGRILIPLAEEEILVIPRMAVRNIGQLELVDIVEGDRVSRRAIRTGRTLDDDVEVLSGLREGERIVATAA
jgi:RND family efflux transporter MFP subunit